MMKSRGRHHGGLWYRLIARIRRECDSIEPSKGLLAGTESIVGKGDANQAGIGKPSNLKRTEVAGLSDIGGGW